MEAAGLRELRLRAIASAFSLTSPGDREGLISLTRPQALSPGGAH